MKIAINGTYIQEQATGLGIVNQNLISGLLNLKDEFDFTVYSYSDRVAYPEGNRLLVGANGHSSPPYKIVPVPKSISPDRGFSGHLKRFIWYNTSLNRQLKDTALFFSPVTEGILFPSVRQIVVVHDLIPLKYPQFSPKWKYYYLYVLPLILKQSERIICTSQHTKKDLIENYQLDPELIDVIYWGFDRQLFYPQPNTEVLEKYNLNKYLLYVGDMRFYKNLSRCLQAFDRLPDTNCQFVITGKKDDFFYPEIKRQVQQLSAKERIIFLDYVPTADLPGLYSMAQALVFASLYEGFGLPVLEAMACGTPVIASDATSIPEVGGDSIFYVNPYSVESISQGMSRILKDLELQKSLRNKGLERAELFSWDRTIANVRQAFFNYLDR